MSEVHVVPSEGKWAVEVDGERAGDLYATEAEATEAGRNLAAMHEADLLVHPRDAPIKEYRRLEGGGGPSRD